MANDEQALQAVREGRLLIDRYDAWIFEEFEPYLGRRILEIGCGDGRLTWRYARQAGQVVAIDPDPDEIDLALQNLPPDLNGRVTFHALGLEEFAGQHLHSLTRPFDRVLLAWSL